MRIVHLILRIGLRLWIVAALASCALPGNTPLPPAIGSAAPPLALPTLDGASLAELRGRVAIVNFWASWCEPCLRETPRLVQWDTEYADAGLDVLGVNTLYQDSRTAVEEFAAAQNISYPVLLDATGDTSRLWTASPLPRSYVVDRAGVVRFVYVGEVTEAMFERDVLPLLKDEG
jgi:cytochrome c biogenesis protein CcmG, thiol:disulfide interchange protein DsbE